MLKYLFTLSCLWVSPVFAQSVAFIGDSISTGGGTHPALAYDAAMLAKVFDDQVALAPDDSYYQTLKTWGITPNAQPPRRLELATREFVHPLSWVYERALHYVSHRYIDAEEYSWSYLWAQKQGLDGAKIMIAARDGERADHALRQIDRLLDANGGQATKHLFIFFTGNDICAPDIRLATPAEDYVKGLERAIRYYVRNAKADAGPHYIWLLDPLGILQIVTSPDILNRKVKAYDKEISCRDLQAGRFTAIQKPWTDPTMTPADIFLNVFGQGPRNYCASLFDVHNGPAEMQMQIGGLLKGYRDGLKNLVDRLQVLPTQYRVRHLQSTSALTFEGADMANDCFHLSLNGQLKIAQAIDEEVRKLTPGASN